MHKVIHIFHKMRRDLIEKNPKKQKICFGKNDEKLFEEKNY